MNHSCQTLFITPSSYITNTFILSDSLRAFQKALNSLKLAKYIGLFLTISSHISFDIRLSIHIGCQQRRFGRDGMSGSYWSLLLSLLTTFTISYFSYYQHMPIKDIIYLDSHVTASIDLPSFFGKLTTFPLISSIYIKWLYIISVLTHYFQL